MAIQKIKTCDYCKKPIDRRKSYVLFRFYGWHGRIFCDKSCLKNWAVSVADFIGKLPTIKI